MKIIHTADVQLGAQFKTLGPKARVQREQIKKTFHKVMEMAANEGAAIILVAGDLFDNNYPSPDLLDFIKDEFDFLKEKNVEICVVPGHHDPLTDNGIYNRERFDEQFENVFIFRDPSGEVKEYARYGVAIFARPNVSPTSTATPFPDMMRLKSEMAHKILAAHGDLQIPGKSADDYHPISIKEVEMLEGIDYVALGHWHSMKDCSLYSRGFKMPVFYSGSPELIAQDQSGSGNIIITEFKDGGVTATPVSVGKRKSLRLSFDISKFASLLEIKKKIVEAADEDTIVQVDLIGLNINGIFLNLDLLEEEIADSVFHINFTDKTHLSIKELPDYPDKLTQGQFVKIISEKMSAAKDEEEKKIYETALQIGLAELEGKEVI